VIPKSAPRRKEIPNPELCPVCSDTAWPKGEAVMRTNACPARLKESIIHLPPDAMNIEAWERRSSSS
jgi:NAD-dependent DNA ligase